MTQDSTPFAALALRFLLVALGFLFIAIIFKEKNRSVDGLYHCCVTGLLFHGVYLGGVFYSVSVGFPAAISALIVCLQPILTALAAGKLLDEVVSSRHWFGLILGLFGTTVVLTGETLSGLSNEGLIANGFALIGITLGTLWQKRFSADIPIATNNGIQALIACLFHFSLMWIFEVPVIEFTLSFSIALLWLTIAVSFGAFSILMYLIKHHSVSQIASLFYLVPPIAAIIGSVLLDEILSFLDIVGFFVSSLGVFLATRPNQAQDELPKSL